MAHQVVNPFAIFLGLDGQALDGGSVYIGLPGKDPEQEPAQLYWDEAGTERAAQPLRTRHGMIHRGDAPARAWTASRFSVRVRDREGRQVWFEPIVDESIAAANIDFHPAGEGSIARTIGDKLAETDVSVTDFMNRAEIEACRSFTFRVDVSPAFALAIREVYRRRGGRLHVPSGGYLANVSLPDPKTFGAEFRGYPFELAGDGCGEAFVVADNLKGGTVIRGTRPDQATLKVVQRDANQGTGFLKIHGIRFEGSQRRGVPVADIEALYGSSQLYDSVFYQGGEGDGVAIGFMATGTVHHVYSLNRDWNASGGRARRVGTGFMLRSDISCGLATFRKCTSRGWSQAYDIGNPSGPQILFSPLLEECECSVVTNGIRLRRRVWKGKIRGCYFEGVEDTAVLNEGDYTTIADCDLGIGFAVGIDDSSLDNIGTVIENNSLQTATRPSVTCLKVGSAGAYGGPEKSAGKNTLTFSGSGGSVAHVIGVHVTGLNPRINGLDTNGFSPRGPWVGGPGTAKFVDSSTGEGIYALTMAENGEYELPHLSQGAVSMFKATVSQNDVAAGKLTVPAGMMIGVNASRAVTVTSLDGGRTSGRLLVLKLENANMTFTDSATMSLAGGALFTGPGTLVFFTEIVGQTTRAFEVSRTAF